jgi:hypothetical protein
MNLFLDPFSSAFNEQITVKIESKYCIMGRDKTTITAWTALLLDFRYLPRPTSHGLPASPQV